MDDKRRHVRLPKNFRLEINEFKYPLARQPKIETPCVDISVGGLKVESTSKFEPGDKLQVRIYIASLNKYHPGFFKVFESDAGQYLQVIAEVVRVEEMLPMSKYYWDCAIWTWMRTTKRPCTHSLQRPWKRIKMLFVRRKHSAGDGC